MPITQSAEKALRQNKRKRIQNLKTMREMKEKIKNLKKAVSQKNKEEAKKILPLVYKSMDKATKRGIIKKNAASRYKSRLTIQVNKIG